MSHPVRPGRPSARWAVRAALASLVVAPGALSAQEGCILGERGNDVVDSQVLPGIGRVTYISNPHFVCDRGVEIFADSAVAYGDRGMSHLMGSVRYLDAGRELQAAEARYFSNEGRLQAEGDVVVVDEEQGSSIRDGDLVYLLQTEFREESEMTVTIGADGVRPTAVFTPPPDTADAASPSEEPVEGERPSSAPYTVVAERHFFRGSGYFTASGDVVIERDSLLAFADSAEYDQTGDGLTLVGRARVTGEAYELTGRTITMSDPGGSASEVRALRAARLTGEDVDLTAARIVVLLREGALERLVATPIGRGARAGPEGRAAADSMDLQRPEAYVEDFVLNADSLEVRAPGERLQRVFAAGGARSVSTARDSLNTDVLPEIARNDWLEGDTVIIRFVGAEPVPPLTTATPETVPGVGDSTRGAEGDAAGKATADSMAASDSATVVPSEAAAERTVVGDSTGPPDATAPTPDSLAPADTSAMEPGPFAPELLATPDTSDETEVEEIIARIGARSLYRLPPNDSTFRPGRDAPAVHYVVGREIRIHLENGQVRRMSVAGQTRGVHLEPLARTASQDSTAVADSALATDTSAVSDTAAAADTSGLTDTSGVADPSEVADTSSVADTLGATAPELEGRRTRAAAREGGTHGARATISLPKQHPLDDSNAPDEPNRPLKEHPWKRR